MGLGAILAIVILVGSGMILFTTTRRRNNPNLAFGVGLGITVAITAALLTPMEVMADSLGGGEIALTVALAGIMAVAVGAAVAAVNMFFKVAAAEATEAPRAAPARRAAPDSAKPHPAPAAVASPPPDVFISYKREERPEVLAIARRLEALKLSVWFDAEMRSGTTFDTEIDRQVRSARAVLVCWSPGAVASDWVRGEATIGRQRNVLAAAILKPCDLPAPFNLVHADDLTAGVGPSNPEWLRLVARIGRLTGRPGLAAFEELELKAGKAAYAAWITENSTDPLLNTAVSRLQTLPA